jgi:hypothetical protein
MSYKTTPGALRFNLTEESVHLLQNKFIFRAQNSYLNNFITQTMIAGNNSGLIGSISSRLKLKQNSNVNDLNEAMNS